MSAPAPPVVAAVVNLDADIWLELGSALTCHEADAFIALLRHYGNFEAADLLLEAHAANDDVGDSHYLG